MEALWFRLGRSSSEDQNCRISSQQRNFSTFAVTKDLFQTLITQKNGLVFFLSINENELDNYDDCGPSGGIIDMPEV